VLSGSSDTQSWVDLSRELSRISLDVVENPSLGPVP
jgi:hypothetical protein